jgi:anaerobic magnesium-protoporphyrin IX monomethyl ester cyclase
MLVTLISPFQSITSLGIRSLSAYLRRAGFRTQVVFLPLSGSTGWYDQDAVDHYEPGVIESLRDVCAGSDLIGVTLMTESYLAAAHLTAGLKPLGIPIAWGGIHPTARPAEALEHADIVCLGEGEEALLELVQRMAAGRSYTDVQNFWFRCDGQIIRNAVRPPIADLNSVPPYDYDIDGHFVLDGDTIVPMTPSLLRKYMARDLGPLKDKILYRTMVTRGCPHNCTYCCNNVLHNLYGKRTFMRKRSPEHVIDELRAVRQHMPFVGSIYFVDDTLFALTEKELQRFSELYREHIGLPFACFGSPATIAEPKMRLLVDAGMVRIGMGIETGSERTLDMYQRHVNHTQVLRAAATINRFRDRIQPPRYDIITDNPWESLSDQLATFDLLNQLPRPFRILSFSLTLYPGTELHDRARREGLLGDEREQVLTKNYWFTAASYTNLLYYGFSAGLPAPLMRIATSRPAVRLFSRSWFGPAYAFVARVRDRLRRRNLLAIIRKLQAA